MHTVVNHGLWIASGLLLFVVALIRFSRPPTNRTGTTFLLFYTGVLFYYALLIGLWLLVIILVSAGGYGFDGIPIAQSLKANEWLSPSLPVIGFLVITVASQFKLVGRLDTGARQFCIQLAAIPAEAEQLAVELAHGQLQLMDPTLIENVSREITLNIGENALHLTNDGSLASRFTRAVSLYWLFIMPDNAGTPLPFPTNISGRSTYTRIMRLNERAVEQSLGLYDSLMENGLACFTSSKSTRAMEDALKKSIQDLSLTVCRLIARWVLYLEVTENRRRKRLSSMGLNPRDHSPAFGRDQWVASILVIIVLFLFMSIAVPGKQPFGQTFMYSVLMAIQLGMAVIAGTAVAQRFIRREEENVWQFPPLAELTIAALVVVGLCIVLRIGWPLVPDLLNTGSISLAQSLSEFSDRWPFVLLPFVCTFSIGLMCAHLGTQNWNWFRLALLGGALNAATFVVTALLIAQLLSGEFLERIQGTPNLTKLLTSLGIAGFVLGAIVLAIFPRSIRSSQMVTMFDPSRPFLTKVRLGAADTTDQPAEISSGGAGRMGPRGASRELGSYSRDSIADLEGRYVCFRPTFTNAAVVNAYEISIHWDDKRACLVFEERNRTDSSHSQIGQVHIPDGRPFMNLVTVDKGAVRLIMVTRPDHVGIARGLMLTLANPGGVHFIPATAPVVLRRLSDVVPQMGFVHQNSSDYATYIAQLSDVAPEFATFAAVAHLQEAT
ncbi:hypothetical protein [Bradyrhizobium viridifuturi]|uniref:hypothetical protein n=1 Tax=Bradyrhizobium viridifuturi TaxID=1654716 RepID=UPI00067F3E33|nr:hypothetical protein [Bradyrhizobium viridifuturi]